jgi:siderophore synthetase component
VISARHDGEAWAAAGRALLARAIGEFAYEEIVSPVRDGDRWTLRLPAGVTYAFSAGRGGFGAWRVDPTTIVRDGAPAADPVQFLVDVRTLLGLRGAALAEAVRDLVATQTADARLLAGAVPAAALAELSWVDLEAHQGGHPCLVLNKGRLGFAATDAERYAPEAGGDLALTWLAVDAALARVESVPGVRYGDLLAAELDDDVRAAFAARLTAGREHVWLPVHPFQWDEVVRPFFAPMLADGRMVELGRAPDRYRPLQSVRTLANLDRPDRANVKVPLMVRNTLVWRGLSADQTLCAPHTTAWLQSLRARDEFLSDECRIVMLGEVASVTVPHPVLAALGRDDAVPYRYQDLLGAIWREPVTSRLEPGERVRSMASLLLVGSDGRALVAELVERSGRDAQAWLRAFLRALLPPLLHYLYRYGASFTPHGENVLVISDAGELPVRIALKDFGADVELLPDEPRFAVAEYAELPDDVRRRLHRWPPQDLAHSILSAICAGHFRFLTPVVERHLGVPEPRFWALVRETVDAYHARFPELAERFAWFDLLAPRVARVTLNREQLGGEGFHDRAERDAEFDVMHGTVDNPLHAHG